MFGLEFFGLAVPSPILSKRTKKKIPTMILLIIVGVCEDILYIFTECPAPQDSNGLSEWSCLLSISLYRGIE